MFTKAPFVGAFYLLKDHDGGLIVMTIGIIGAMNEEIALLLEALTDKHEVQAAGTTYYTGILYGQNVVICKSGVGKVNAAVTTQVMIDRFDVGKVLFTGVAGAIDPELNIGDIVISSACLQHDMDVTPLGFKRGEIPYQEESIFAADPALVQLAQTVCESRFPGRYRTGIVLSGDQFIACRDKVRELHETFQGACTEMEGSAVAQTCARNSLPFVVIRSMSDRADGSADMNFAEFTVMASKHSHLIIQDMLQSM